MVSQGVVREWHHDEGWGVIDSAETPGGAWAHFSEIQGVAGFRALIPGSVVRFAWESPGQDGFDFRAIDIDIDIVD